MKKVFIILMTIALTITIICINRNSEKYLLITQPEENFFEFYLGEKKFLTINGKIKDILINKHNPAENFYIYIDDKFIKYPENIYIDGIKNNNYFEGNAHQGSIWIDKNKNVYRTVLQLLPFDTIDHKIHSTLDCSEKGLSELFQKYQVSVTKEQCQKQKQDNWGVDAVCQLFMYNKENNTWEIKEAILTNTEASDTVGCSNLTYKNMDKNYKHFDNTTFTNSIVKQTYLPTEFNEEILLPKIKKLLLILKDFSLIKNMNNVFFFDFIE